VTEGLREAAGITIRPLEGHPGAVVGEHTGNQQNDGSGGDFGEHTGNQQNDGSCGDFGQAQ